MYLCAARDCDAAEDILYARGAPQYTLPVLSKVSSDVNDYNVAG
jgi:hypothetical protein